MGDATDSPENTKGSPLSLNRLRHAFAAMLGDHAAGDAENSESRDAPKHESARFPDRGERGVEINPRSVVEAILFVGRPDNGAISSRELAAAMRGVSPSEIEAAICQLNALYDVDGTPYCIEESGAGFRLVLRESFTRMRDKFYAKAREAKLSPAAMDVLAIVAYNQPMSASAVNELRGAPSGAILSTLVRRRLLQVDRAELGGDPLYTTTDRFLKLFGLESLSVLPRSEELEKT